MATKKRATKKAPAKGTAGLPTSSAVPAGFKQLGGGYADSWNPEPGDVLCGEVTGDIRELEVKRGRKTVQTRVMEVTDEATGKRLTVWESATLAPLFDTLAGYTDGALGSRVWIQFDGLGKKKTGQNPPKLFTVAIAE